MAGKSRFLFIVVVIGSFLVVGGAWCRPLDQLQFALISDVPSGPVAEALLRTAYQELDIEIQTLEVPSRRALLMANAGDLDGDLFRIANLDLEYKNLLRVPYPLLQGRLMAVAANPEVRHFDDLVAAGPVPPRVAVRRGVAIAERTAYALGMEAVRTDSYRQMHDMLELGRVDMALISEIEGFSPLDGEHWMDDNVLADPVVHFMLYHYLHRRHGNLVSPLAEVLERMANDGQSARIRSRYRD